MKRINWIVALATVMATTVSAQQADYVVPPVKTLAQAGVPTTVELISTVPQKVTFAFRNMGANFLNAKPSEISTVEAPDATKEGKAYNASFAGAPSFFNGKYFCLAVAGPNTWAGIDENKKFDLTKMPCVVINGKDVRVSLAFAKPDTYVISPVIVQPDGKFVAWGFHPEGETKRILVRPDGKKDMATMIHASAGAPVAAATDAQAAAYQGIYTCYFTTEGKCGEEDPKVATKK